MIEPHEHRYFRNRFGDLECLRCHLKLMRRGLFDKKKIEDDVTISV